MTWIPIWATAINKKFMLFPLVTSSLSFGYLFSVVYGNHKKEHIENLKEDEQEMSRWSSSLQDPTSLNYQPFTFINK